MKMFLENGAEVDVSSEISAIEFVRSISNEVAREVTAICINGIPMDVRTILNSKFENAKVKVLTFSNDELGKSPYWHTASHVLAQAVKRIFPNAKLGIGPAIENGFFYDFDIERTFSESDISKIETEMKKIIKENLPIERFSLSKSEAIKLMEKRDEIYKVKLIEELDENEEIFFYKQGEFVDFCKGPHLMSTGQLKAIKIMSLSGAYWKGNENNKMLKRIYGIAFPKAKMLEEYLDMIEKSKQRDHRKIGKELGLFCFNETAPGMAYWLPKGWIIYNTLVDFWREKHRKNGYLEFSAPQINSSQLWKTSGHWDHYKDDMYVIEDADGNEQALKPMSCPNAIMMYKMSQRSYKELPLRFNDIDVIHRNEKSGQLNGLFRVRMFRQDDSHNFIMESQIGSEIKNILEMANDFYKAFGLEFKPSLSTRPDNFMGEISVWDKAETQLKQVLDELYGKGNYPINEGDGAFYGPKIDIQMKDCLGRKWQMGTIQLDFQLPIKFDLEYVKSDGSKERPIIIHRAIFGSFERFIGVITEHFAGAFPVWISPIQVQIIPVTDNHIAAAQELADKLELNGIRVQIDSRNEKLGYRIREAQLQKIPYMAILGDNEVEAKSVSIRSRIRGNIGEISIDSFVNEIKKAIEDFE